MDMSDASVLDTSRALYSPWGDSLHIIKICQVSASSFMADAGNDEHLLAAEIVCRRGVFGSSADRRTGSENKIAILEINKNVN